VEGAHPKDEGLKEPTHSQRQIDDSKHTRPGRQVRDKGAKSQDEDERRKPRGVMSAGPEKSGDRST